MIQIVSVSKPNQCFNFNFHRLYHAKKGIILWLQHRVKAISGDSDAYLEEMKSLRYNLHHNNYSESITSAPRNLYRTTENYTRKHTTVCLPYIKGLSRKDSKDT